VRRAAPWALLFLVLLGAAAAAALGIAEKASPTATSAPTSTAGARFVAGVLVATERAGSAHFSYSHVTESPNPDLVSSLSGHGVVDFARDDVVTTEVGHDVTATSANGGPVRPVAETQTVQGIVIGGVQYMSISGFGAVPTRWTKVSLPFPGEKADRSLQLALNASTALAALRGQFPVSSVSDLGPSRIGGVATTEYQVRYAPVRFCLPHRNPVTVTQRPSLLWVDAQGRMVRVRSSFSFSGHVAPGTKIPHAADGFSLAPTTMVATVTFWRFGAPVRITPPPVNAVLPSLESVGKLVAHSCTR
jgi:hypothetical protein